MNFRTFSKLLPIKPRALQAVHRLYNSTGHCYHMASKWPLFNYSETWQLIINTGTTIITFLMVFLIQKSQNKDSKAIQLKLNELIAASKDASNRMVDIEDLTEKNSTSYTSILLHWRR